MSRIVVAIVRYGSKILMARRRQKEGNLHWQFPGGAVNEGETDFDAAQREIHEETNTNCKAIRMLGERIHPTTGRQVAYILCEYVSGDPEVKDTDELDRVEWMASNEIFRFVTSDIFPPVKEFLKSIVNQ